MEKWGRVIVYFSSLSPEIIIKVFLKESTAMEWMEEIKKRVEAEHTGASKQQQWNCEE